jgi:uncharacterized protein YndB with AHSA1/START domain
VRQGAMSPSNEITATVTHTFAASPEKVFDAWITGEKVREWFAPGMGEMVRVAAAHFRLCNAAAWTMSTISASTSSSHVRIT